MDFNDSQTKENLMRSFAGESQARNRYTIAAELAMENNLFVIKQVFDFTADQERAHGEEFYEELEPINGQEIKIEASYPVNTSQDIIQQLKDAVENETKEAKEIYRTFGDIALEEGFNKIAGKFYMIADIEQTHANRFEEFYKLMSEGKLFVSDVETGWMCLNCGYIVNSKEAPKECPVCHKSQGYFIRLQMAPFEVPDMIAKK